MLKKDPETAKAEDDRSIWILSDGKAGDEIQCMGVAEALGLPYQIRRVAPRKPFVWAMPWGRLTRVRRKRGPAARWRRHTRT
ncbi:ELM1/GtrOC1 family putative glycosyltransferase [Pannonibacter sp. Pt2-lr]